MPRRMVVDRWLFFTAGLLVVAGLFLVGSASHYVAMSLGRSPSHFLARHALHVLFGSLALAVAISVPYQRLSDRRLIVAALAVSVGALLVVLAMPTAGGAHRWLRVGPLALQPSEFAKLAALLFVASLLSHKEDEIHDLRAVLLPSLGVVGLLAFLIVIEPDLGSAVMLAATAGAMLFVAGVRWKVIGAAAGVGVAGLAVSVALEPYRLQRIKTFLDPTADTQGAAFQLTQSLIAVGSGGLTGVGLGQGQQKAFYLPAPHTDFIFSVVGEEMGLVGTGLLLLAFLILFWRGMRTALRAPDRFGFYLAMGITCLLVLQGLVHMGVCLGLLPTKGLPLPFVSYGGSSLMATMAATGLLLNVSQHSN